MSIWLKEGSRRWGIHDGEDTEEHFYFTFGIDWIFSLEFWNEMRQSEKKRCLLSHSKDTTLNVLDIISLPLCNHDGLLARSLREKPP